SAFPLARREPVPRRICAVSAPLHASEKGGNSGSESCRRSLELPNRRHERMVAFLTASSVYLCAKRSESDAAQPRSMLHLLSDGSSRSSRQGKHAEHGIHAVQSPR